MILLFNCLRCFNIDASVAGLGDKNVPISTTLFTTDMNRKVNFLSSVNNIHNNTERDTFMSVLVKKKATTGHVAVMMASL